MVSGSRVSVCEIRLMRESPWVACFFTPRPTLFVRSHGPTFVVRIWPPIAGCFSGLPGYRPVLGSLGSVPVPGKWPHILGHFCFKKRAHLIKHRSQYIKYITPLQHPGMVPSAVSGRDREQDFLIQCVGRRLGSWFLNARTKEPTEKMFYSFSVQTPLLSSLRSADFCSFSVGSHSFHHVRCPFPAPRAADRSRSCVPIRLT